MAHLKPLNAAAVVAATSSPAIEDLGGQPQDAVQPMATFPMGCTTVLDPGIELDSSGGAASLCSPWEADLYGCAEPCYWPAQVPDIITHPGWTDGKLSGTTDWRELGQIYPKE